MTTLLTPLARLAALLVLPLTLLTACSRPELPEAGLVTPAQYTLKDIRYFLAQGEGVDTTIRQLPGTSVQNPGNLVATRQVEDGFGELVKTSRFTLDGAGQLPADLDLSSLRLRVPHHWYGNGVFDYSPETYPLSPAEQQTPYGFAPNRLVSISIPPRTRLAISRQVTAYYLTCSVEGILENQVTGQRYRLQGKWRGLLQYDSPSTTLKESAL